MTSARLGNDTNETNAQVILEVAKAVSAHLDLSDVLEALIATLKPLIAFDAVGVGVRRRGDRDQAVLGQEVQRHRVGAGDAAAADDPEAQRQVDRAHVRWASSTQLPSGSSTIATF